MTAAEKIMEEDAKTIASASLNWSKLNGKTILISGANGYVPQYFVHGLLKRNDLYDEKIKVVAMCRSQERAEERFFKYIKRTDFELLLQDVCVPIQYEGNVDYIIHAASPAGMKKRYENPIETFRANVVGCENLLEFAQKKKSEFLLISSVDIYGKMDNAERLTEEHHGELDPLNIRNVYSCAKRAAETLCSCYVNMRISCKIVRPFQILAGGIQLNDGRLHADFIAQMLNGDEIVLKGDGTPRRTFMYVTDAIIGMLIVLLEGNSGEAYNLCTEKGEASVLELAQIMASHVTDRKIQIKYNMETRVSDPAVTQTISTVCGSSEKIRQLNWEAKLSLSEACKRIMTFYGVIKGD